MTQRYQAPPFNPKEICFCCAGGYLARPWDKVTYEERMTFTFIPRYTDPNRTVRYCHDCEAQRCRNMPGRNHYHMYLYVPFQRDKAGDNAGDNARDNALTLQMIQLGRVINTVGGYRESLTRPIQTKHPAMAAA